MEGDGGGSSGAPPGDGLGTERGRQNIQLRRRTTAKLVRRESTIRSSQTLPSGEPTPSKRKSAPGPAEDYNILDSLIAGCIAGSIADIIMYPLDTINTRQKIKRGPTFLYRSTSLTAYTIVRKEGISGLFGGVGAAALSALPSNAVYFGTYEWIKQSSEMLGLWGKDHEYRHFTYMAAGAASEVTASIVYFPFELVKTRLQLGEKPEAGTTNFMEHSRRPGAGATSANYKNTFDAFSAIARSEGIAGFYRGYSACILTDCSYSAVQWVVYEFFKDRVKRKLGISREMADEETLVIGGFAGGIAALVTNPLDTITARVITQGKRGTAEHQYKGVVDCARTMIREEGATSLFQGWQPRTIRFSMLAGVTFIVYERVKKLLYWERNEGGHDGE